MRFLPTQLLLPILIAGLVSAQVQAGGGAAEEAVPMDVTAGSTLSGVFTEEQARIGAAVYARACESCHGPNLTGGIGGGSPIAGNFFFNRWVDASLSDLFVRIKTTMPLGAPGSLSDDDYADVLAYVLDFNKMPPGNGELSGDLEMLAKITIGRPSPED